MVYIQIGMESSGILQEWGHALLVQRDAGGELYTLRSQQRRVPVRQQDRHAALARRLYGRGIFQYALADFAGAHAALHAARKALRCWHRGKGYAGANPSVSDYEYQLYADSALRTLPLSPESVPVAEAGSSGTAHNEALAGYALNMVRRGHAQSFRDALETLSPTEADRARRQQSLAALREWHDSHPAASSI